MVRKRRKSTRSARRKDPLTQHIGGVAILAIGGIMLAGVLSPGSGNISATMGVLLKGLVGLGAIVIPLVFIAAGLVLVGATSRIPSRKTVFGFLILYVVFLVLCQMANTGNLVGFYNNRPGIPDQNVVQQKMASGGGILGLGIGAIMEAKFGRICTYFLLFALGILALPLVTGVPLQDLFGAANLLGGRGRRPARAKQLSERRSAVLRQHPERPVPDEKPKKAKPESLKVLKKRILQNDDEKLGVVDAVLVRTNINNNKSKTPAVRPEPKDDSEYMLPPITLLKEPPPRPKRDKDELAYKIGVIERTLEEFKIIADVVEVSHGPTVTRYEIQLAPGIKVSKIVSLADNLAMALAAIDVRVEAPIPGKSAIGVEVPNNNPAVVTLRQVIDNNLFWNAPSKLSIALGEDVAGEAKYADLTKMPHMLVAGATNAGKSVCLNSLIASLLFRVTPREVKFVLIDPKRVELSLFDGIPHLCTPVVKDVRQATGILRSVLKEMDRRYDLFVQAATRNFDGYNAKVKPEEKIPYIVVIVDEVADLMMQAGAEVEFAICRLAQLARATGIHLIVATQRPSVDVITGTIKANISSRIAFAMNSQTDSRTILDMGGAERLIGRGDMLFKPIDVSKPTRIQGCLITEKEIEDLVKHLKEQETPDYTMVPVQVGESTGSEGLDEAMTDEVYEPAVRMVVTNGYASTSMIQRRFKIGYTRAARLVDAMESQGIVGPLDGAKPREVLVMKEDLETLFGGQAVYGSPAPQAEYEEEED